ncbi:Nitrilase/cyanide hydratase and apolipoprotein N-acyltransferase family protein [Klebsormidium nitens]|uniref:Nitrilase/cyanide hydratase and apolipoprotein N-acyltransferase family protein n=1 Tax=Klebsormidium nitens TaxID=105231 RepID=A0A1Y1IEJ4_KLENI|nr:Nitrilase/cyanide hydratase and apolipoprotein N-acyltransferase family protein [Klebsormidium nitens]|eukprot:GAQ87849.1 Nitrilase/cyanide hydratase and apolipoprotein N-acyltransferase family protein [Klebsormidium nitens]
MASSAPASASGSKVDNAEAFQGKVKLAVCQLSIVAEKQQNIDHAREVIEKAADDGARLIVLPEMWNCPYSNDSFPTYAEDIDGGASPSTDMLSDTARARKVTIIGGSIPERSGGKLYNTCCIYGSDGKLLGKHRKMHLFDIDIPGKITFRESDTLSPGNTFTVVKTDVGCIGVGICYDIRFPELAMLSAAKGAQILCYPGAFNMTTGPLHWELLAKARAVDNQLFVVTCSPARDDGAGYIAWGHSTVIGPFGKVEAALEEKEGVLLLDIDLSEIETRRTNMPLEHQRRHDVYQLVEITDRNRSAL